MQGEPHIRFYAGFPLIAANGMVLGSFCAIDIEPKTLSPQQISSMERLARQVVSQMELRRETQLLQSAELALLQHEANKPIAKEIQLLMSANSLMNREQLLQMLTLMLGLDVPPCFALARCKFTDYSPHQRNLGIGTSRKPNQCWHGTTFSVPSYTGNYGAVFRQ